MRILILFQNNEGGTKNATGQIVEQLRKRYPQEEFITYAQPVPGYRGYFTYTRRLLWSMWDYRKQMDKHTNLDCVYATEFSGVIAHELSKKKTTPIFFHFHGKQEFIKSQFLHHSLMRRAYSSGLGVIVEYLQKSALEHADRVCFASEALRDTFIYKHKLRSIQQKSITIGNGVSRKDFYPVSAKRKKELRKAIGIPAETKVVLYIGRIDVMKGLHKLINAMKHTKSSNISLYILYPKGVDAINLPYLSYLKKEAYRLWTRKKTSIEFFENPQSIPQWYQASDCVVLPSERDNFPLVMLEAFASGTPFMGTQVGSIQPVIEVIDERLLLHNNDELTLAAKLNWFFNLSQSESNRIRRKGIKTMKQFTWGKTTKKIYSELMRLIRSQ